MATVPNPMTWEAGKKPLSADMNREIRDPLNFLLRPPRCKLYRLDHQTVGKGSYVACAWDAKAYDTDTMHPGTVESKVTAVTPGVYTIFGKASLADIGASRMFIRFTKNSGGNPDVGIISYIDPLTTGGSVARAFLLDVVELEVNDYVEMWVYQNNVSSTTLRAGVTNSYFAVQWAGVL